MEASTAAACACVSVDRRYVFREFAQPALYPSAVDSKIAVADLRSRVESNGRSTIRTIEKTHYDRVREAKVYGALYISVGQRRVIGFGKRHAGLRGNHLREHKPQFVSGDRIEPRRNVNARLAEIRRTSKRVIGGRAALQLLEGYTAEIGLANKTPEPFSAGDQKSCDDERDDSRQSGADDRPHVHREAPVT